MFRHRIGIVGLSHDHTWSLIEQWKGVKSAQIVGVSEHRPICTKRLKERHPDLTLYATVEELFDKAKPTAIQLGGTNAEHAPAAEVAAARGIHVLIEKPMAATLDEAERIIRACEGRVRYMVNWSPTWRPYVHLMDRLIEDGRIGRVFQIKQRGGHAARFVGSQLWFFDKQENGGGALIDFCGYGANYCRWWLGYPHAVTGLGGTYEKDIAVEDNALLLIDYGNAMGICEATWTQVGGHPYQTPIIWGTEGILRPAEGGVILQSENNREGEFITAEPLSADWRNSPTHFIAYLEGRITDLHPLIDPHRSRDVQEVMSAGLKAIVERRTISLPLGS